MNLIFIGGVKNEKYYLYYWSHSSNRSCIIVNRLNIIDKNENNIYGYESRTTHKFSIMSFYYAWSFNLFNFRF